MNGEGSYSPLYERDKELLAAWGKDVQQYAHRPEMKAFGHRFADVNESSGANKRGARDDLTALRLTKPGDWMLEDGYGIIGGVKAVRRQRKMSLKLLAELPGTVCPLKEGGVNLRLCRLRCLFAEVTLRGRA